MTCFVCKGDLEARLIRYVQDYKGSLAIIENVPAEVCTQCGKQLLRPEVADKVQRLVWDPPTPRRQVAVPVYDLAELA
jgi:HTH-type transcriptional regulator/antitoxin MqsA